MSGQVRIGCMGELLVEFVCSAKNSHHRTPQNYFGPFPSGAPGIFIDQASRVGGKSIFVGSVGEDAFGDVIMERLQQDGVDTRLISKVRGVPTGSAFVGYNDDGSRDFVYNIALSAAVKFAADEATIHALAEFSLDVLHVSGAALGNAEMCAKIMTICTALHQRGVKISFDPNVRKELMDSPAYFEAVRSLMNMCSIFLPSEDDAAALFPSEKPADFAARLLAGGVEYVVLKKGDQGAEAFARGSRHIDLPPHKVEVLDPTGAGDCFCATFVTLISSGGFDLAEAMRFANAAGALAVTKIGPMEGNSTLADIGTFLGARS